jgi:hypothetical protein
LWRVTSNCATSPPLLPRRKGPLRGRMDSREMLLRWLFFCRLCGYFSRCYFSLIDGFITSIAVGLLSTCFCRTGSLVGLVFALLDCNFFSPNLMNSNAHAVYFLNILTYNAKWKHAGISAHVKIAEQKGLKTSIRLKQWSEHKQIIAAISIQWGVLFCPGI